MAFFCFEDDVAEVGRFFGIGAVVAHSYSRFYLLFVDFNTFADLVVKDVNGGFGLFNCFCRAFYRHLVAERTDFNAEDFFEQTQMTVLRANQLLD